MGAVRKMAAFAGVFALVVLGWLIFVVWLGSLALAVAVQLLDEWQAYWGR